MKCENCVHARLIASKENRAEYVGCIKTDGMAYKNKNQILNFLNDIKYTGKTVAEGWIYNSYPNANKPENGQMFSTCLLVEKDANCKFFAERVR